MTSLLASLTSSGQRKALLPRLEAEMQRRTARASLTEFARRQGFDPAPHHRLLITELEALARGDNDTLVVMMPPGSAKSTYVNWLFPAWFMGRQPRHNVLTASHSTELAERWGRKTRNLVASQDVFPVRVADDSGAAGRWSTADGGEYYAVGVGVGIAGFRADGGIIDDPFGSREDAESKRIRDNRWEWYRDDFLSRLKPGAWQVIMHTRWHDDDLAGRALRLYADLGLRHRVLCLPAEAVGDDPLGRAPGELLWDDPEGYNYGALLRRAKQVSSARSWASLYQQNPVPDEGAFFKAEWFHAVDSVPPRAALRVYGASDYAVTSDGGDYTVHVVIGLDAEDNLYLLDLWRRQADSAEWVDAWCDLVLKWRPMEWAEETGQIRSGVGPFLDKRARERRAWCVRTQFPTRGDKAVRAQSIRARSTFGVRIPAGAPWRAEFIAECLRFPAGVHDDQVDAFGLAGQLLDKMYAPAKDKPVEKAPDRWARLSAANRGGDNGSWRV